MFWHEKTEEIVVVVIVFSIVVYICLSLSLVRAIWLNRCRCLVSLFLSAFISHRNCESEPFGIGEIYGCDLEIQMNH